MKQTNRSSPEGKKAQYEANRRYIDKVLLRSNKRKDARCVDLLGYDGATLRRHIERQFTSGMSWDRFGRDIHIDHIVPIADYLGSGVTDPAVIHALTNLRPMWAKDNAKKGSKRLTLL